MTARKRQEPPDPILAGPLQTIRQLVAAGLTPAEAVNLNALPIGVLWRRSDGPAAIEEDPSACPIERAMLAAIGWSVTSELSLDEAIGIEEK